MKEVNIQEIKYGKKFAELIVDGEVYKKISLEALVKSGISKGILNKSEFNKFLNLNEKLTAKEDLFSTLSRSLNKSEFEYRQNLKNKQYSDESVDYAISIAKQYGYVDDLNFAKQYIDCNKKQVGEFKLRYDLGCKGVSQEIIEKAISLIELDDENSCYQVLEKYLKNKPLDFKTKQKAYRFLASKGFAYDLVNKVLDMFEFKNDYE